MPDKEEEPIKILRINTCEMCNFFHLIQKRDNIFKGYCENPENKNHSLKGQRKITINPNYEGAENRTYLIIDSKYIPRWCKLPNYVEG